MSAGARWTIGLLVGLLVVLTAGGLIVKGMEGGAAGKPGQPTTGPGSPGSTIASPRVRIRPGAPGSLISAQEIEAPTGAKGWRVLYHSRDLSGRDVEVSGTVFVPSGRAPAAGRPVLAWAHPTTGSADSCAPSLNRRPASLIPAAADYLRRGYVIAATDYQGLGTKGPHPYLVTDSLARSVIDSVRAAGQLTGVRTTNRFAVVGENEGALASLGVARIRRAYAPKLRLVGVVAGAVSTDLPKLAARLPGLGLTGFLVAAATGISAVDPGAKLAHIMTPQGQRSIGILESRCSKQVLMIFRTAPPSSLFTSDLRGTRPWAGWLRRNSIVALPRRTPVLILQGARDVVATPASGAASARTLCRSGARVDNRVLNGVADRVLEAAPTIAEQWVADRFESRPFSTTC